MSEPRLALLLYGFDSENEEPVLGLVPMDEAHLARLERILDVARDLGVHEPSLAGLTIRGVPVLEYAAPVPDARTEPEIHLVLVPEPVLLAAHQAATAVHVHRSEQGALWLRFDLWPGREAEMLSEFVGPELLLLARLYQAPDAQVAPLFRALVEQAPLSAAMAVTHGIDPLPTTPDAGRAPRRITPHLSPADLAPLLESHAINRTGIERVIAQLGRTQIGASHRIR